MKLTNFFLIILIGVILYPKIGPKKSISSILKKEKTSIISIEPIQYKEILPIVKRKNEIKHSTTFRSYVDSDSRSTIGINHNIRIGKIYYLSGGITTRQNSFGKDDYGINFSITKYW